MMLMLTGGTRIVLLGPKNIINNIYLWVSGEEPAIFFVFPDDIYKKYYKLSKYLQILIRKA